MGNELCKIREKTFASPLLKHQREGKGKKNKKGYYKAFCTTRKRSNVHALNCHQPATESFSIQTQAKKLTQPISSQSFNTTPSYNN